MQLTHGAGHLETKQRRTRGALAKDMIGKGHDRGERKSTTASSRSCLGMKARTFALCVSFLIFFLLSSAPQLTHPSVLESIVFSARTSRTEGALTELPAEETADFNPFPEEPNVVVSKSMGISAPAFTTEVILCNFLMVCSGNLTVFSAEMYSFDRFWASCC